MSSWRNCNRPAGGGYHAPDLVSRHGTPCPNVFLTRPGDLASLTDCPGRRITGSDGHPYCRECAERRRRAAR